MKKFLLFLLLTGVVCINTLAQQVNPGMKVEAGLKRADSTVERLQQLPAKYFSKVSVQADKLQGRLSRRTEKALRRLQRQEELINRKLSKIDAVAAHNLLTGSLDSISHLQELVKGKISRVTARIPGGKYIPYLDSLQGSLNFLDKYRSQLSGVRDLQGKLHSSLGSVQQLEGRLQQVENVQQYIQQQQQILSQALSRYGQVFNKYLGNIGKEAYYYRAQVENYKELWKHPDQVEAKALELLNKVPAFTQFMKEHSMLAGLFNIPAGYGQSVAGLQTRAMVERQISQQLQAAGPNGRRLISQQMQQAKQQLEQLKSKFPGLDNAAQMPNFQPKELKSKTFLQRVQLGANIQFAKSSQYFPSTSDIALQAAYKFAKNGSIGLGTAYKLGLGNIHKIRFTSQGLGLRSFLDYKLKGTIYANGGFEFNYNRTIPDLQALRNYNGWTKSALLGVEKKYKVSDKVNGDLLLLYDFLHSSHIPATQPLVFRVGYNF